jgi:hypothetical protein
LACSERKGKWRRQPGAAEFTAARAEQRKGGGTVRKEDLTGGVGPSAAQRKREKEAGSWAAAGGGCWADGPAGLKGKEVSSFRFYFLFKSLSNSNFSKCFQNISNTFKTFETSNLHTEHYAIKI